MRRKHKLTDFMPVYSDDRMGKIVIDENATSLPVVEHLPELHGGEILTSLKGLLYLVHRVRKPKRDNFDEPIFRLERLDIIGNNEWTLQELSEAGLKIVEGEKVQL